MSDECKKGCGQKCCPTDHGKAIEEEIDKIWAGKSEKKVREMVNKHRQMIYNQCGPWSSEYLKLCPQPQREGSLVDEVSAAGPATDTEDKEDAVKDILNDIKQELESQDLKQKAEEAKQDIEKEVKNKE